ncbi:MAG TPA: tetratricopeptide repeat protein [Terriglobales bacterium]|nr:tetratricopeptide repeat protein [Terriglobales bacterium]
MRFPHLTCLSLLLVMVTLVPALAAQTSTPAVDLQEPGAQTVPVSPPPLRRVEPPSPTATAGDLETEGDRLRAEKSYLDAMDYYLAAMKKSAPGHNTAILQNKLGITQLQMVRFDDAKKSFERSVKSDKSYADAYNNLGVVFYLQKRYSRAVKYYRRAIELKDGSASFHSNLGTAYFAKKEFENSVAEYNKAMQIDPEIFERKSGSGIQAHMSSPEDRAHYSYVIARMYAQRGQFDQSLLYLRRAMEDGYPNIQDVYKDAEFTQLRKDPRFTELMAQRPVSIPQ